MAGTETRQGGSGWLSQSAVHRFTQRVTEAIERARKSGVPTLASVSEQLPDGTEVVPLVLGARKHFAQASARLRARAPPTILLVRAHRQRPPN